MNITIVSSSTRSGRVSPRIAFALEKAIQIREHRASVIDLKDVSLPDFIERHQFIDEADKPGDWDGIMDKLLKSDGLIFVSPEYNGGISSGLKNFIDVFAKKGFEGKPIGVATGSAGSMGGIRAAYQLQQTILCIHAYPQPQMLTVGNMEKSLNELGEVIDPGFEKKLNKFLDAFLKFTARFTN